MCIRDSVIAATWRRTAFVVGDGVRTVRQLIQVKNAHPSRGREAGKPLKVIDFDEVEGYLGREGLESVPEQGCEVRVIGVANISRGGESQDVTDLIHVSIRQLAEKISNAAQLGLCGVDLMIEGDISKPLGPDHQAVLIELNGTPMITLHHFPSSGGHARNVAGAILDEIIRRRRCHDASIEAQTTDERTESGEKYFAPVLSNPEELIPLSQGEIDYHSKNQNCNLCLVSV